MGTLTASSSTAQSGGYVELYVSDLGSAPIFDPIEYHIDVCSDDYGLMDVLTGKYISDPLYDGGDSYSGYDIPDYFVGELQFILYTSDDGIMHDQVYVTVSAPSYDAPTIGLFKLIPVDGKGKQMTYAVQGVSKINVLADNCFAGSGNISRYVFNGQNLSRTTINTSESTASVTSEILSAYGNLSYEVTVTNTYGKYTHSKKQIYCYPYSAPYFTYFRGYRSDASGNADTNGVYITYEYQVNYSSVNNSNSTTVTVYCKNATYTEIISELTTSSGKFKTTKAYDINTKYELYAVVSDVYGKSGTSEIVPIYPSGKILNVASDGESMAIGGLASSESGVFDCYWDANFHGDVNINGSSLNINNSLTIGDDLTVGRKANFNDEFTWISSSGVVWSPPEVQLGSFPGSELYIESSLATKNIKFNKEFKSIPFVSVTPVGKYGVDKIDYVAIESVSSTGFSALIKMDDNYQSYLTFHWIAVAT